MPTPGTYAIIAAIAQEMRFHDHLRKLIPHRLAAGTLFRRQRTLTEETAFFNSSLQGGYFILGTRLLGVDCGSLPGFNAEAVNKQFFDGASVPGKMRGRSNPVKTGTGPRNQPAALPAA
jgi:3-hydroxypropanoate dehydrogenase